MFRVSGLLLLLCLDCQAMAERDYVTEGLVYIEQEDYKQALSLFKQGAKQGNTNAQFHVGGMYLLEQGVPQSYTEAYVWFTLASMDGNENAVKGRDIIAEELSSEALLKAQERAKVLYKQIYE